MRTYSLIQNHNSYDQLQINAFHGLVKRISEVPSCTAVIKQSNMNWLLIQEDTSFFVLTPSGFRPEIVREEDLIENDLSDFVCAQGTNEELMGQLATYMTKDDELVVDSMTSIGNEGDFARVCLLFISRHINIRVLDQSAFSTKPFEQLYEQKEGRRIITSILTGMYINAKKFSAKDMPGLLAKSLVEAQITAPLLPYERRNKSLIIRIITAFHHRCNGYMENAGVRRFIEDKFGSEFSVKDSTFRAYVNEAELRYHNEESRMVDRWLYFLQ